MLGSLILPVEDTADVQQQMTKGQKNEENNGDNRFVQRRSFVQCTVSSTRSKSPEKGIIPQALSTKKNLTKQGHSWKLEESNLKKVTLKPAQAKSVGRHFSLKCILHVHNTIFKQWKCEIQEAKDTKQTIAIILIFSSRYLRCFIF